jgi:hypothetical protein
MAARALDLFAHQPPTVGPFHARGSDTSREAAERIRPTLAMRQAAVLGCLRDFGPQTAEEIADRLGLPTAFFVMPRLTEMAQMDPPRVRKTADRRVNRSGSSATVWAAIP